MFQLRATTGRAAGDVGRVGMFENHTFTAIAFMRSNTCRFCTAVKCRSTSGIPGDFTPSVERGARHGGPKVAASGIQRSPASSSPGEQMKRYFIVTWPPCKRAVMMERRVVATGHRMGSTSLNRRRWIDMP